MKTRATEQNIIKYLKVLKELKLVLDNTPNLSMLNFSTKHNVTKNLSTVLQKGGVIKLIKKGRYTEWKWVSIEPTREMAIKTLQELTLLNPPRKVKEVTKDVSNLTKKENIIEYYYIKLFFGFIKLKITPKYK